MFPVRFVHHAPRCDRFHFVNPDDVDVDVVPSRLPPELWARLRAVHFNDQNRGRRVLGYVNRGRREIALCALPPRVSLAGALPRRPGRPRTTPSHFGAQRGRQWPDLAVRRFMLYETLLHEIGHLQEVDPRASKSRRRFAHERLADEFAAMWRRRLWAHPFDHPDPAHNPPAQTEFAALHANLVSER